MERGRPRTHESAADRQRAYRKRQSEYTVLANEDWEKIRVALREMRWAWLELPEVYRRGIEEAQYPTAIDYIYPVTQLLRSLKDLSLAATPEAATQKVSRTRTKKPL